MTNWQAQLQNLTNQIGALLQSSEGIPQIQAILEQLQMGPLVQALNALPYKKLQKRVEDHRPHYQQSCPPCLTDSPGGPPMTDAIALRPRAAG